VKIRQILSDLFRDNNDLIEDFLTKKDADFAYIHTDGTPFRVNAFFKL